MNPGARKGPHWTPAEDAIILELGPRLEAKDIAASLPGRSVSAVFHRWHKLGVKKRRLWTRADERHLMLLWGSCSLATVASKLGRSAMTTYWRAQRLGLGLGCPRGYEYLSDAATRAGFATSTLRMILRWAGVHVEKVIRRRVSGTCRRFFVNPERVDDAVAAWLATETPEAASRRLGLAAETIVDRLLVSGLPLPPKPGHKRHWRIPSDTIDRAMAMVGRRGKHLVVLKEAA